MSFQWYAIRRRRGLWIGRSKWVRNRLYQAGSTLKILKYFD